MQGNRFIKSAVIDAVIQISIFAAALTVVSTWPTHATFLAAVIAVIVLQITIGRAFPMKGQGGSFQMLERKQSPTEFGVSIIMQVTGAAIISLLVIGEFLRG